MDDFAPVTFGSPNPREESRTLLFAAGAIFLSIALPLSVFYFFPVDGFVICLILGLSILWPAAMVAHAVKLRGRIFAVTFTPRWICLHRIGWRHFLPWASIGSFQVVRRDRFLRESVDELQFRDHEDRRIDGVPVEFTLAPDFIETLEAIAAKMIGQDVRGRDMEERDRRVHLRRRRRWRLVGVGLLPVVSAFALCGTSYLYWHERQLDRDGVAAVARIIHIQEDPYNGSHEIEYSFIDRYGQSYARTTSITFSALGPMKNASTVDVRYLPWDPEWSEVVNGEAYRVGILSLALWLGFLVFGSAVLIMVILDYDIRWEGGKFVVARVGMPADLSGAVVDAEV